MKKSLLNILVISLALTIIGLLMDSDPKEPSMLMRFAEFFAMTTLLFVLISALYYTANFAYKKIAK